MTLDKQRVLAECIEAEYLPTETSWRESKNNAFLLARHRGLPVMLIFGERPPWFEGDTISVGEVYALKCPLTSGNLLALQQKFPELKPVSLEGHDVTMGLGDRLGLVSGAHIAALAGTEAFPVLAQQSKRELNLTGRSYRQMLDDVAWQVFEAGYHGGYAADGDHLKTLEEVRAAIADGATMITLDCSEHIDPDAYRLDADAALTQCREKFTQAQLDGWTQTYCGKTFPLPEGRQVIFDETFFPQMLLTYGAALDFMETVYQAAIAAAPHAVSFEISIDETEVPTTPEAHYFIARELAERQVVVGSVAPRFCGEFQKGVDYRGDTDQFQREFAVHAAIAEAFGYRVSVHSGSDKFSIFPYVGKLSGGRFHLKTSGTSWVEAVRVIAMCDPALFRRMAAFSRLHFEEARAYYHVSASLDRMPDMDNIPDKGLPALLDMVDTRQVMHITYGFLLQAKNEQGASLFRDDIYRTLQSNKALLDSVIQDHIRRHLTLLGVTGQ